MPTPKSDKLGTLIDSLYKLREKRFAAQRKVDALEESEALLAHSIRIALREAKLDSGRGKAAVATITHKIVAIVEDWPELWKWIKKRDAFDLFQRRIGMEALEERLKAGEKPPIKTERVEKLSLTKIRK